MSSAKPKFLVLHPDPASVNELIGKINAQNSKIGPFAAVILLGNVLPRNIQNIPDVTVYYMLNQKDEATANDSLQTNEKFIGVKPMSIHKLHCGITMAFVDTQHKAEDSFEGKNKVDLMFSFHWPHAIAAGQRLTLVGNRDLDHTVRTLCPRYHFAVGTETGRYFENPHFLWENDRTYRFISLGREKSGSKWFYAFGLGPGADVPIPNVPNPFITIPDNATTNEGETTLKRGPSESIEPTDASNRRSLQRISTTESDRKRPKISPDSCFFCLSNPKVETHMIVAIGKHSYLTIAKGPLPLPTRALDFCGHGILIPIDHNPTASLPQETSEELRAFQDSLASAFHSAGHSVVFFEISRPENVHFHIQMVPIPKDLIKGFDSALETKANINNEKFVNNQALSFRKFAPDDAEMVQLTDSLYVRFSIYENLELLRYYLAPVSGDKALDLQFPRRVLAYLLRMPKRQNWDRCRQTVTQETSECNKFKKFYEQFDITK